MAELLITLLGPFAARVKERPLTQLTAQKAQALLIYLVVESRQVHQRDALMTLLWPDYPQKSAQQSLRQTLYLLRQAIEHKETDFPLLLTERATVALNPDVAVTVDVVRFEQLSDYGRTPQEWQQAVELYRGDFLSDFYLPDSDPFEEWAAGRRAFYQRRMQELLQRLVDHYLEVGDYAAAETAVRRQLTLDNLQEPAHRQLMEILARNGRRQEALTHFDNLSQLLHTELGIEPDSETRSLVEAIRADKLTDKSSPPSATHLGYDKSKQPRHNLPHALTSFIGREKELSEISDLIAKHRLVMLTGVGGIGKTTLAIQAGHQLLETFSDGVWLVELAPVADPERVAQTAVYALGLRELSNRPPVEVLLDYLDKKKCLLIFDNCEHLIQASAQFTQSLLQALPQLKILATSREIFDLPGETAYYVPPLTLPEEQQLSSLEKWTQYEALRLFADRAATVMPAFQVTADNLGSLHQICQRLDGIPLALELAAAQVKVLTTKQIATRLEQRFSLLTSGNRSALPRQQTLRALVDWSWELLSASEQILLRRLSVFAGGLSLEAVEAVCTGNGVTSSEVLNLMTQLVNKSLVIAEREQGQETRYRLLETIRQYGQEQLAEAGEREQFQRRHLDYFGQLGKQAEQELVGPDQAAWLNRLEMELDNVRAALRWARAVDIEAGLRLATALWKFWDVHGYDPEGEKWISQMLKQANNVGLPVRARALGVQSDLNFHLYNLDLAHKNAEACLALYRELNDPAGIAFGLNRLAIARINSNVIEDREIHQLFEEFLSIYRAVGNQLGEAESLAFLAAYEADKRGNYIQAREYLEKSLALYKQKGHLGGMSFVLYYLGWFAKDQSDFENARSWLEESVALQELLGSSFPYTIGHLADLHALRGDYEQAQYYTEKSIALSQRTGQKWAEAWGTARLGYLFLRMGKLSGGRHLLIEGQQKFLEAGHTIGVIWVLEKLASLAVSREQPEKAVRIFAWADVTREAISNPRPPIEKAFVDEEIANILEMIDEETYAANYASGQAMTMEEAIALAVDDNEPTAL